MVKGTCLIFRGPEFVSQYLYGAYNSSCRRTNILFQPPLASDLRVVYINICRQNIHTYKKIEINKMLEK